MPCSVASLVPSGPGYSVSPICAACALLLCLGRLILQASHLQRLSLPIGAVFGPWPEYVEF